MNETIPRTADERLELMLKAFMKETRSSNRRSFIIRILMWVYLIGSTIAFMVFITGNNESTVNKEAAHLAKIEVVGEIKRKGGVSASPTIEALVKAFEAESSEAIILDMDSPGGSAAQSDLIYRELMRLRAENPEKPVYAIVGDVCASGCYYIASAADEIIINRTSMVGSIGVRMDGFDLTGLMDKVGVERRILSAGENKVLSDPFVSMTPKVKAHLEKQVLAKTHSVFIDAVQQGRGDRLVDDPDLYTGLVWVGQLAIDKGLADRFGSVQSVIRDQGDDIEAINYTRKQVRLMDWITGKTVKLASSLVSEAQTPRLQF